MYVGHAVALLVEALRYRSEGHGSITDGVIHIIPPVALWPSGRLSL